jgi:hypothetical protein
VGSNPTSHANLEEYIMKDKMFTLFFICTIVGTFTTGFVAGKRIQTDSETFQVNRTNKSDKGVTTVAKNP